MELEETTPEELIDSAWLDDYEGQITAVWWELVRLSSDIFILEKIEAFSFELFQPVREPFWVLVSRGLFDSSVMTVWKLAFDRHRNAITLPRLRNGIMEHLQSEEYRSRLRDVLRSVNFDGSLASLERRIRDIRNKMLAHVDFEVHTHSDPLQVEALSLRLSELVQLQTTIHSLFRTLCFGRQKAVYPIYYHPDVRHPPGVDSRPDVERLLDCVAKESAVLNMPEQQPEVWPHWRSNLSSEFIETLNQYRRKFGLVEV